VKWKDIKLDKKSIRQLGTMLTQVADVLESGMKSAEALGRIRITIDLKPDADDDTSRKGK
jgi:hypothetical protein